MNPKIRGDIGLFRQLDHVHGEARIDVFARPSFSAASGFQIGASGGRRTSLRESKAYLAAIAFDL
jgi:hypothetical protein